MFPVQKMGYKNVEKYKTIIFLFFDIVTLYFITFLQQ